MYLFIVIIILLILLIFLCLSQLLFKCKKINIYQDGGGRVIIPFINERGICYIIATLNMILDSDWIRHEIKRDKNDILSKIIHYSDFSVLDQFSSGGSTIVELIKLLDKYRFKNVSTFTTPSGKISSVLPTLEINTQIALDKALEREHNLSNVIFIRNGKFINPLKIYKNISYGDNKYLLSGILYGVLYELESMTLETPSPYFSEYAKKYNLNHAIYVSYNEYEGKWNLLTDDLVFAIDEPCFKKSDIFRFHESLHVKDYRPHLIEHIFTNFTPILVRYEKPYTKKISVHVPEKHMFVKNTERGISYYGTDINELLDFIEETENSKI